MNPYGSGLVQEKIQEKTGMSIERLKDAWKNTGKEYQIGKISYEEFRDRFSKYLGEEGKKITPNLVLEIYKDVEANQELLDWILELKNKFTIGILTDNNTPRFETIKKKFNYDKYFQYQFSSGSLGATKHETKMFNMVCEKLNLKPEEIIFVDNQEKHIETATKLGFNTILYKSYEDSLDYLKQKVNEIIEKTQ